MIIIDHLTFYNSKILLDFDVNDDVIYNDNFEEVMKQAESYKPKIYPIKKKDIKSNNFLSIFGLSLIIFSLIFNIVTSNNYVLKSFFPSFGTLLIILLDIVCINFLSKLS